MSFKKTTTNIDVSILKIFKQSSHLAVIVVSVSSHQVDSVAVLVPERSLVRQGTVGDGNVIVMIVGGKRTAVVVGHGVA